MAMKPGWYWEAPACWQPFRWFSPFALFTGFGVTAAYALLGSTWLIMKTEGELQQRILQLTRPLLVLVVIALAVVSIWTPLAHPAIADRWFSLPNLYHLSAAASLYSLLRELKTGNDKRPFISVLIIVLLGLAGLAISIWPHIIPSAITIWDAAALNSSLKFTLAGTLAIVPVILGYSIWFYHVFRGKVRHGDGYH